MYEYMILEQNVKNGKSFRFIDIPQIDAFKMIVMEKLDFETFWKQIHKVLEKIFWI